ncbi:unnamed protein product [Trichobilharzia regenti]|nr:unnamed protein product [Trichobilharzia regenti]
MFQSCLNQHDEGRSQENTEHLLALKIVSVQQSEYLFIIHISKIPHNVPFTLNIINSSDLFAVYFFFPFHDEFCFQKCTAFMCDKKLLDRINKNRRRELILETLRSDLTNLNKLKHPRFLQLIQDIEENK